MKDYKVYTVGGAVRDWLLGNDPKDIDYVVVGSTPAKMLEMGFQQVGADFPVFLNSRGEEYALARRERKTGDGYLGFTTETDDVTLEEDLSRRDLTINAMAMDEHNEIVDPFNGREDLNRKVLRHVSDAFSEDPLRVIRLARFFARYDDFTVAVATQVLCEEMVRRGDLNHLPNERFWAELVKVFSEKNPGRFFALLSVMGAFEHIKFFKGLYDTTKNLGSYAQSVLSLADAPEQRVMLHVALTAKAGDVLNSADNRTIALYKNVANMRQLTQSRVTADRLLDLLKQAKAWSDGPSIPDLCDAMAAGNLSYELFALSPGDLSAARAATAKITSAEYMELHGPGRALGAAIERGRKEALVALFNLRDDEVIVDQEI